MWLLLLCRSSRICFLRSLLLFSGCLAEMCLVFLSPVFVVEKLGVFFAVLLLWVIHIN